MSRGTNALPMNVEAANSNESRAKPPWPRYLDPRYHLRTIVQDIRAFGRAVQGRRHFGRHLDRQALADAFRGKLFGSFFLSGGFSFLGFVLGAIIQGITGNPWIGLFATILIGHLTSTAAFQAVWWLDNHQLYRETCHTRWGRFMELQRDLWPIHSAGFRMALAFGMLTLPLNSGILFALTTFAPAAATLIPAGLWVIGIDLLVVNGTFVRIMGDLFERYSFVLADKYRAEFA